MLVLIQMVLEDILPSTVNFPRFTKAISNIIYFTPYIKGVIVGLILSDGWLTYASKTALRAVPETHKNARLGFKQSAWSFFISLVCFYAIITLLF